MVRLGAPDYLKLVQSNSLDVSYAGAEANVAVSLSHYGISTVKEANSVPLYEPIFVPSSS